MIILKKRIKHLKRIYHTLRLVKKKYRISLSASRLQPSVVFMCDESSSAGLADRLKGLLSTFAFAKATGRRFYIHHHRPFEWSHFLAPNEYDWTAKDEEVSFNLLKVQPVYLGDTGLKSYRGLSKRRKQLHFYNNLDFIDIINRDFHTDYSFSSLFKELFAAVPILQKEVEKIRDSLGKYIAVNFSFHYLLTGDARYSDGGGYSTDIQKDILIKNCISQLNSIHNQYFDSKILVTSDTQLFIDKVSAFDWVYTTPGKNGFIFYNRKNESESDIADKVMMNTFLDFLVISHANKIIMARTGCMYRSNYVRTAARIYDKPYEEIQF